MEDSTLNHHHHFAISSTPPPSLQHHTDTSSKTQSLPSPESSSPPPTPTTSSSSSSTSDQSKPESTSSSLSHSPASSTNLSPSTPPTPSPTPSTPASTSPPPIPQPIFILSLVSASLTLSSSVFNTALPIYMVTELKMSMASMGMFDGMLEAFSYIVRMMSGVVSDAMTSRKSAITVGFAMGAMAKFGMASATTVSTLFAAKAVDRLANGVQAAPRDALIGDLSPEGGRSACYGFAQSMRKWGSMVGALMAYAMMRASGNNYQLIFAAAASVSLASCIAFVVLVPAHKRPETPEAPAVATVGADGVTVTAAVPAAKTGISLGKVWGDVRSMGSAFWRMLVVVALYGACHINESLLEARAIESGIGKAEATLVVAALCAVTFLAAYPLGRLDDKFGPRVTFAVGMSSLILGNLILLLTGTYPMAVFVSCLFLGIHWAVIQGPMLSIVVGLAPAHLRGTAFGIFYTVMAFTAMLANTMYGAVWHNFSAPAAFGSSAALMVLVLAAMPSLLPLSKLDVARVEKQQRQQQEEEDAAKSGGGGLTLAAA
ncbi:MAG: hypothetical protein WDW36_008400 [Sanguina aurantia]